MRKNFLKFTGIILIATAAVVSCSKEEAQNVQTNEFDPVNLDKMAESIQFEQGAFAEIPNQYIVVFNEKITEDISKSNLGYETAKTAVLELTNSILGSSRASESQIVHVYAKAITGITLTLNSTQLSLLENDARVAFIEKDVIVQFGPPCGTPNGGPCDPGGGGGDQETPWGITRVNGGVTYSGSSVAWILDSGIDLTHSDLNVNAASGFNAFTSGQDGQSLNDGNGHGTHVAGTIAAIDNSEGVIGVAAGATVVPVKVLNKRGSGSYSGVIAGVDHVANNGSNGDVANMSLGGPISVALESAISGAAQTGVRFFLAAGNEAQDANNVSPARLNGNNIYTISAMSQGDNWASFSNYGNPPIDYCAPGVGIKSTWKNGGYNTISGTSMATPHAAGIFLLGNANTDGTVNGDPSGPADLIVVH